MEPGVAEDVLQAARVEYEARERAQLAEANAASNEACPKPDAPHENRPNPELAARVETTCPNPAEAESMGPDPAL